MIGLQRLSSHWWVLLLRGLLAIIFGVLVFVYTPEATAALVILFGAFALVDGVLALVAALRFAHPSSGQWWALILQGLAGAGIGVLTFFQPFVVWLALGYLVAVWAIVTGIFGIGVGIRMRRDVPGEIFLIFAGLLSIAAGVILAFNPLIATIAWTLVIAVYALAAGVVQIVVAVRLRGLAPKTA